MAEMAGMSKDYIRATRHATIHPVSKKSEMTEMPNMTATYVMQGLGEVAV
jgi:hypothetical protein